jgi:two-component system NtrC family sensor kinase
LACEIVTKGHGGELKAETKEGEGSRSLFSYRQNKMMKKLLFLLLLIVLNCKNLFAQDNNDIVSFRQIPIELRIQIGFLFVYILLGILFLMLFIFYPRQQLNLHFSLYNISLALLILNEQYLKPFASASVAAAAEGLISRMIGVNVLLFILYALDRVRAFYWWLIGFILFIDFPLSAVFGNRYLIISETVRLIFTVVCFLQIPVAFKNKTFGSWLIGVIASAVVLINVGSVLYIFSKARGASVAVQGIVPFIITICAVIYLALRYGRTNISLEQQLIQVQKLSEENLKKEQEKQQLLAIQNEMLEKQVIERTAELRRSLDDLRSAQAQLIQSEKMVSLGELTAGIAHEIQNPLNFVNNFSDVNKELVEELKSELAVGNVQSAVAIAANIGDNEDKINHHGKRADSIVKGMLQHSRSSSGQKELTDINKLADEYSRLAYHGFRAKDKTFNAKFETDFDDNVGKVDIIPQDIGRVILNLINNAFYAVNERAKLGAVSYEPRVLVSTKRRENKIEIKIEDNGSGIPQKIVDKIFQPFFTTKPTGQGTGLGLSLAYDIVKAHGGELKVQTNENEGSEFIILLPLQDNNHA